MPTEKIIIAILGGLFVFVGGVAGLMIRIALLMFTWRREIDDKIAENNTKIGMLEQWKIDHTSEAIRSRDELRIHREKIMQLSKNKTLTELREIDKS